MKCLGEVGVGGASAGSETNELLPHERVNRVENGALARVWMTQDQNIRGRDADLLPAQRAKVDNRTLLPTVLAV